MPYLGKEGLYCKKVFIELKEGQELELIQGKTSLRENPILNVVNLFG